MSELQNFTPVVERTNKTVSRVSKLEVRFEASGIDSKRIYANGRMQVRVWIFVEAVDENGQPVQLEYFPDLITARLIHYHNGEPLKQELYQGSPLTGWNASRFENQYVHEMPGGVQSIGGSGGGVGGATPIEVWVSSSVEGQAQIAAEVTVQGKVYKSNNTVNPDGRKINKSIVVHAEQSREYSADQFVWQSHPVQGDFGRDLLFLYHLGLYPAGRQIRLLDWKSTQYGAIDRYPVVFCNTGLILGQDGPRYFVGVIAPSKAKKVDIYVSRDYTLEVNRRAGELTAIKGVYHEYSGPRQERVSPFHFIAIDEFGDSHNLSLETDVLGTRFVLRKGFMVEVGGL